MDKDIIILQDSTKTHIWYIKTKPHDQSRTVTNRSAHQICTTPVLRSEMVTSVEEPEPHKLQLRSSHLLIEIRTLTDTIRTSFINRRSCYKVTLKVTGKVKMTRNSDPHQNRGDPHDPHDLHHLMLFFLMPQQRSMVPVASGALFALERLILWLLWILWTLWLMILFSLLVGEQPSTLGERTNKGFPLVHEKVLSELVLSGKPLGTLGTLVWSQRLIMISLMFL